MSTQNLIRWGGLSALFGGIIGIASEVALFITTGNLSFSDTAISSAWLVFVAFAALSTILSMLGLVALFSRQFQSDGKFGAAAFILAFIGTMMVFGHQWTGLFVVPVLAEGTPDFLDAIIADTTTILAGGVFLSVFLMAVGWVLFGFASLRVKILPQGSIWLVTIGAFLVLILSFMNFDLDKVVFYLGLAWMGWWLWSEKVQKT